MSSAGWILVALLFIVPFYDASETTEKDSKSPVRHTRSIMDLGDMVKTITGREGQDFVGYGNWCGIGGSGDPIDPVDECCQNHDMCYDSAKASVCKDQGIKGIYLLEYKWRMADDETAVCEDETDQCKLMTCVCDAVLSNCLKSNIKFYNPKNHREMSLYQMLEETEYLTS